eukprot:4065109-Alexandrium_andersonii.AAC.1
MGRRSPRAPVQQSLGAACAASTCATVWWMRRSPRAPVHQTVGCGSRHGHQCNRLVGAAYLPLGCSGRFARCSHA